MDSYKRDRKTNLNKAKKIKAKVRKIQRDCYALLNKMEMFCLKEDKPARARINNLKNIRIQLGELHGVSDELIESIKQQKIPEPPSMLVYSGRSPQESWDEPETNNSSTFIQNNNFNPSLVFNCNFFDKKEEIECITLD